MQADGEGDGVVTESQKVWREVQESLRNEDFEKAIQLCNTGKCVLCVRLVLGIDKQEVLRARILVLLTAAVPAESREDTLSV